MTLKLQKNRHMSRKIDIIKLFTRDYSMKLNGREIARRLKINHQTAFNHLNELEKESIVNTVIDGRNKLYSLNLNSLKCQEYIDIAEKYKSLERLDGDISIIIEELLKYSETIILFGSYAEFSENKESDIDLIIIGKSDKENITRLIKKYPVEINIEYITLKEFKNSVMQRKALAIEILKKHILFGEISPIIKIFLEFYKR